MSYLRHLNPTAVLFMTLVLTSAINYGINLQLTHWLEPDEFAAYAVFLAVFWLVTLIPVALQQAVARNAKPTHHFSFHNLQFWGWIAALGLLICAPLLAKVLHIPLWWLLGLGAVTPLYCNLGMRRGYWQALEPSQLAFNFTLELLVKLVAMLLLWQFIGWQSAVVAPLVAIVAARLQVLAHSSQTLLPRLRSDAFAALCGMVGQTLMSQGDLILAQAFLPAHEAGIYAAVTLVGKVVFFAIQPIGITVFARVAQSKNPQTQQHLLFLALGAATLIGSGVTLLSFAFGEWFAARLFGQAFRSSSEWLGWYALASALNALAWLVCQHLFALGSHLAPKLLLFGAALQIGGIVFFHSSGFEIILVQVLSMGVLLAISLLHIAQQQWLTKGDNTYVV